MNSGYVFVSFVGTQLMGTLQPLLALVKKHGPLHSILLPTERTLENALAIQSAIAQKELGSAEICQTGNERNGGEGPIALLGKVAARVQREGKRICFNLDGGMNYMIATAVLELEPRAPLYIQAGLESSVLCDARNETFHVLKMPEPLSVPELLALQRVPHVIDDDFENGAFSSWAVENNIIPPKNCLRNVRIDNFIFDYVWNPGNNRLHFFKFWRNDNLPSSAARDLDRDFAHWSTDRARSGQLYDKRVLALVFGGKSVQRLRENSSGQIEVIDVSNMEEAASWSVPYLNRQFASPGSGDSIKKRRPSARIAGRLKNNTLVCCMGTNLSSTLKAIASHKPEHLVLCCSNGKPLVGKQAERLLKFSHALGLKTARLAPLDEDGAHCENVLPEAEPGARVLVNITPGTKGQGAMLARWAMRHRHELWSLNNGAGVCSPLRAPAGLASPAFDLPDPAIYFQILGQNLKSPGLALSEIEAEFPWLDAMLLFMRRVDAAGLELVSNFQETLKVGGDELKKTREHAWELTVDGQTHVFGKGGGKWFEKLCARALERAGAKNVRLNMELKWNEAVMDELWPLRSRPSSMSCLELDVVGIFEGNLALLSAKGYDLKEQKLPLEPMSLDEAVGNVRNTAAYLGRFTLSVLANFGSSKKIADKRVAVVGWADLASPERLAARMRELARSQSTTS